MALSPKPNKVLPDVVVPIKKEKSNYTSKGIKKPTSADPIRSQKDLKLMIDYLEKQIDISNMPVIKAKDYAIFIIGITTGLRISDIIKLKIRDVLSFDGHIKPYISVCEQKTGKMNKVPISPIAKQALNLYFKLLNEELVKEYGSAIELEMSDYLWITSPYANKIDVHSTKPISKSAVYQMLRNTAEAVNIYDKVHVSTHTLRKTFG